MSLLRQGKAQTLTIYLGESDQWQGRPLYSAIVQTVREQGGAGITVTRALAGYGAASRLHESGGWRLSSDAPIVIQIVDQPERLRRLLPQLQSMMGSGLMTLQEVDVLKYTHAQPQGFSQRLRVQQIMEISVTTIPLDAPITTIIDVLLHASFRALPVVDEHGRLQGIISTGDLINAGVLPMRRGMVRTALELDSRTVDAVEEPLNQARESTQTARNVMNRDIYSIHPEQSVREAAEMMLANGLRRLPVVDGNGILVGMLSRGDLLQSVITSPLLSVQPQTASPASCSSSTSSNMPVQEHPIADYVNPHVATVDEQSPFAEVIDALTLSPLKRVIVVDQELHVKGIISDVDVLARMQEDMRVGVLNVLLNWVRGKRVRVSTGLLRGQHGKAIVAADMMNTDVVTIVETATVQEAIERMIATRRKVLLVLDAEGHLLGVVGRSDVLRILIEE